MTKAMLIDRIKKLYNNKISILSSQINELTLTDALKKRSLIY